MCSLGACLAVMLVVLAAAVAGVGCSIVSYDGRSLILDGERRIVISGSIHYPRSTPEVISWSLHILYNIYLSIHHAMRSLIDRCYDLEMLIWNLNLRSLFHPCADVARFDQEGQGRRPQCYRDICVLEWP